MLHDKYTKRISELANSFTSNWSDPGYFYGQFKAMPLKKILSGHKHLKAKGYSFEVVFVILLSMVLVGENTIHSLLKSQWGKFIDAHKDVFYRLKNNESINWRTILMSFAKGFKRVTCQNTGFEKRPTCLIFDDTLIEKTGIKTEGISRVFDHVGQQYPLGYKMLAMAFWDGVSLIPLDFSFHRERGRNPQKPFGLKKKDARKQQKKARNIESMGHIRFNELDISKISSLLRMLKDALRNDFIPDYVLVDSWFTCEELIKAVKAIKKHTVHLLGMYKIASTKFGYNSRQINIGQIRVLLGKPKRYRKANYHYLEAQVTLGEIPLKLYFSRQGKNGKWKTILSTDTSLSFSKMIELYQTRWTIEVLFKECKQLLKLGKCQSSNLDAQIAETTISLIQYIMLSLKHRFEVYESKGEIFKELHQQAVISTLNERLWGLLLEIIKVVEEFFEIEENMLMKKILNDDRAYERMVSILPPLTNVT